MAIVIGIGVMLTVGSIYAALKIVRSENWVPILLIYVAMVVLITGTANHARASLDGGWGTTSFNLYEGSMGTSWNHQTQQSRGGWSSFWGRLFSWGQGMPTNTQ